MIPTRLSSACSNPALFNQMGMSGCKCTCINLGVLWCTARHSTHGHHLHIVLAHATMRPARLATAIGWNPGWPEEKIASKHCRQCTLAYIGCSLTSSSSVLTHDTDQEAREEFAHHLPAAACKQGRVSRRRGSTTCSTLPGKDLCRSKRTCIRSNLMARRVLVSPPALSFG